MLRIDLWDESVTGIPCPLPTDREAFPRSVNGNPTRFDPAHPDRIWTGGKGSVTELDRAQARIVGWRADGSGLSIGERARPCPVVLQAWLQSRGVVTLHAAAVARAGRAALIVGNAGAGKSTTALACAAAGAGFAFLGDDQIAMRPLERARRRPQPVCVGPPRRRVGPAVARHPT